MINTLPNIFMVKENVWNLKHFGNKFKISKMLFLIPYLIIVLIKWSLFCFGGKSIYIFIAIINTFIEKRSTHLHVAKIQALCSDCKNCNVSNASSFRRKYIGLFKRAGEMHADWGGQFQLDYVVSSQWVVAKI